jgi:outer membrane immunogenic protein
VTGLEFDATWSGMDGRRTFGATTVATEADLLASARGRIGYAHSFWHIYLTGGLALGDVTTRFTSGGASAADSSWRTGFVWGGGIEAKADTRVSIRLEALHYDLGSETARTSVASSRVEADITTVRAGVTFHFN